MKFNRSSSEAADALEAAAEAQAHAHYVLRLFVTGTTAKSSKAIVNIRKICEEHLRGRYELEIVDLSQNPTLAAGEQIIAAPTLIKRLPQPLRRFIGDMSETERILHGLDLRPRAA
ncbi:MAG: circadian clock KaiB family protein [Chthoniobacteraceae bacterium]